MRLVVALMLLVCAYHAPAQYVMFDEEGQEVFVQEGAPEAVIKRFLKQEGGLEIVYNPSKYTQFTYPFKVRTAKGWFLYTSELFGKNMESGKVNTIPYDSIGFPTQLSVLEQYQEGENYVLIAKDNGRYQVFCFPYGDQAKHQKFTFSAVRSVSYDRGYSETKVQFLSKQGDAWGLVYGDLVLQPHAFEKPEDIPLTYYEEYIHNKVVELRKAYGVDIALHEAHVYVKARNAKTGKWGVFYGEGNLDLIVPLRYDQVIIHPAEQLVELWDGDQVGCYLDEERKMEATYQDLKLVSLDYRFGIGLKNEKGWIVLDSENFEPITDQPRATVDAVLEDWLNR